MSEESIKPPHTTPKRKTEIIGKEKRRFKGICLKQDGGSFIHRIVVNLYISYKLDTRTRDLNIDFTLVYYLFGAANQTNSDPDKFGYSGDGIGFDARLQFSFPDVN